MTLSLHDLLSFLVPRKSTIIHLFGSRLWRSWHCCSCLLINLTRCLPLNLFLTYKIRYINNAICVIVAKLLLSATNKTNWYATVYFLIIPTNLLLGRSPFCYVTQYVCVYFGTLNNIYVCLLYKPQIYYLLGNSNSVWRKSYCYSSIIYFGIYTPFELLVIEIFLHTRVVIFR